MSGYTFVSRHIAEVVPGRVFVLSGFEFNESYFVVSDDQRELIGIDAGTRADSAKAAYEALRAHAPNLPELTTIFVTHSHWDHISLHSPIAAAMLNWLDSEHFEAMRAGTILENWTRLRSR